jgi:hypothetical protein
VIELDSKTSPHFWSLSTNENPLEVIDVTGGLQMASVNICGTMVVISQYALIRGNTKPYIMCLREPTSGERYCARLADASRAGNKVLLVSPPVQGRFTLNLFLDRSAE